MTEPTREKDDDLKCGFCGKTRREVAKLIAGSESAICNECVGLCVALLLDEVDKLRIGTATKYVPRKAAEVAAAEKAEAAAEAKAAEIEAEPVQATTNPEQKPIDPT